MGRTKKERDIEKGNKCRVEFSDIYKSIASGTCVNQEQAKIVIEEFFKTIEEATLGSKCPPMMEIVIGNIGKLVMSPRAGRKAGTYKRPSNFGRNIKEGELEIKEYELEEDEPSYSILRFEMFDGYRKKLKKASSERSIAQGWVAKGGSFKWVDKDVK